MVTCGQHKVISCQRHKIITGFAKFTNAKFRHKRRGTLPKRSQEQQDFDKMDKHEIWKKSSRSKIINCISCCCLVVVD